MFDKPAENVESSSFPPRVVIHFTDTSKPTVDNLNGDGKDAIAVLNRAGRNNVAR